MRIVSRRSLGAKTSKFPRAIIRHLRAANTSQTWERFVKSKASGNEVYAQHLKNLFEEPVFREARRSNQSEPAIIASVLAKLQGYVTLEADKHREASLWFGNEKPTLWAQPEIQPAGSLLFNESVLPDLLWVKKTADTNYLCFAYAFTTQSKTPRNIRIRLDNFEKLYPGPAWSVRLIASGEKATLTNDAKFGPVGWIMKATGSGLGAEHPEGTVIPSTEGAYRHMYLGARRAELLANARAIREELLA